MFYILITLTKSALDDYGVGYETEDFEKLISTPTGLTEYGVPSSCEIIYGGGDEETSSFRSCISTIQIIKLISRFINSSCHVYFI